MKLNILGKRYLFFFISLAMIVPGLVIIAIHGLPLSIDFTGGSMVGSSICPGKRARDERCLGYLRRQWHHRYAGSIQQ